MFLKFILEVGPFQAFFWQISNGSNGPLTAAAAVYLYIRVARSIGVVIKLTITNFTLYYNTCFS